MGLRIEEPDRLYRLINNRDSYSDEFKGLVLKLLAEGKSVEQAASFARVSPQAVYEWVMQTQPRETRPRPVWAIAHKVNQGHWMSQVLDRGANAIEFDVMSHGASFVVRHDFGEPVPVGGFPTLRSYLPFAWQEYPRLTLLYIDYKGPDFSAAAGRRLVAELRAAGIPESGIPVIISTARLRNRLFLTGVPKEPWVAPGVDQDNTPADAAAFFQISGFAHAWYGDGITEQWFEPARVRQNIDLAIRHRNRAGGSVLAGVVVWTLDRQSSMRRYLRRGVDAIMTNDPDDAVAVLAEREFSATRRKANHTDAPWPGAGVHAFTITPALNLGSVSRNTPVSRDEEVIVTNVGTARITLTGLALRGPHAAAFLAVPLPTRGFPLQLRPGEELPVRVSFRSSAAGVHEAEVVVSGLDVTNRPVQVVSRLSANVVVPLINVMPSTVHFGSVVVGQSAQRNLLVANGGAGELRFRLNPQVSGSRISGTRPFRWPVDLPGQWRTVRPGHSETVVVRFEPMSLGWHTDQLTIESNDRIVHVSLLGDGIPPPLPSISVAPSRLSFGAVTVGRTSTLALTVSNGGDAPLLIHSVQIEGPNRSSFFFPGPQQRTIQPGHSSQLQVSFTPSAMGPTTGAGDRHHASLVLVSNADNAARVEVELFGVGTR